MTTESLITDRFIAAVLEKYSRSEVQKLIVVTHLVPGVETFLLAVNKVLPIAAVIPKPNSIDLNIKKIIGQHISLVSYTRDEIKENSSNFIRLLDKKLDGATFAIIDMGGYFSHILMEMKHFFASRLIGIVEDTENGHQRYLGLLASDENQNALPYPVISVARSSLKEPEDLLVGQSIVFSAEALLRERGELIDGKRALVFGFGKIGKSIAQNLQAKRAHVDVLDINSSRQIFALAHGYRMNSKHNLLGNADLIFCATGNQSLKHQDMLLIKDGAYVFTATSADDEIEDHVSLIGNGSKSSTEKISVIQKNDKFFYLCNNGNSVNFIHGGVVGSYIKLVQAELVYATSQLTIFPRNDCISELSNSSKRFISDLWLQHFALPRS